MKIRVFSADKFVYLVGLNLAILVVLFALVVYVLAVKSAPSILSLGAGLLGSVWNTDEGRYGLLAPLLGSVLVTVYSIPLIIVFSIPLVVLAEEYLRGLAGKLVNLVIDMSAGLPTVIYAYIGLAFMSNVLKDWLERPLHELLGFLPLFACRPLTGQNLMTATVILSISAVPYMAALVRESLRMIPKSYVEASYSIGLYKEEVILMKLSMVRPAIVSALLLSSSRVLTETTIVSLVAGNQYVITPCALSPVSTIPSLIVNNFGYSVMYPLLDSVLFASSLILFVLSLSLNAAGLYLNKRFRVVVSE